MDPVRYRRRGIFGNSPTFFSLAIVPYDRNGYENIPGKSFFLTAAVTSRNWVLGIAIKTGGVQRYKKKPA